MTTLFAYLSKKIAMPNNVLLKCLSWNGEQGWIACGGENGLLKVLKLEAPSKDKQASKPSSSNLLSMNQTLEGLKNQVMVVTWNEGYKKLTTSDHNGLIIVWMLHKGMWFEEMINNRNKSFVKDMKWTADGQKICIVYEDGAVIVGSVDGNRLWGKELNLQLAKVQWSPDARVILFCTTQGECHIYDSNGNAVSKLSTKLLQEGGLSNYIVGIDWYTGRDGIPSDYEIPVLALCTDTGRVQLMKHENDDQPIIVDTKMKVNGIKWNPDGTVLAVFGQQHVATEPSPSSVVTFYSNMGYHWKTLRVPGTGISSLSWEGTGLRVSMAVDSFMYFANIKPPVHWGYMNGTLVYAYHRPERSDHCLTFWHIERGERIIKFIKRFLGVAAFNQYCVILTRSLEKDHCSVLLCNSIGAPIETKTINFEAEFVSISSTFVVVTSKTMVYIWNFVDKTQKKVPGAGSGPENIRSILGDESMFHIDDKPSRNYNKMQISDKKTANPISSVCVSDSVLLVGRENGTIHKYSLPHLKKEGSKAINGKPMKITMNCKSNTAATIDIHGFLKVFSIQSERNVLENTESKGALLLERKDVWDMKWSNDDANLFAIKEKNRMYVFRNFQPEEPITCTADLCYFDKLEIKSVKIDELLLNPDAPHFELIVDHHTKALRDVQEVLNRASITDAYSFITDNSHPRLWKLLAEHSLQNLNFVMADKAFVQCADFHGIQFVKQLQSLDNKKLQQAEVCVFFKNFNEAERIYLECERPDLAIDLRMKFGNWFKVEKLLQKGGGNDEMLIQSWNKMGDYYSERQMLTKAVQYYAQAKNTEKLVECLYSLEDYAALTKLIYTLPDGHELLQNIGAKLMSVGICSDAVKAFVKSGNISLAVDCCVTLNQWQNAIRLAENHDIQHIEDLLIEYANKQIESHKYSQAIELFRKAHKHNESAKLLLKIAKAETEKMSDTRKAKKLYVLCALELDSMKNTALDGSMPASPMRGAGQVLDGLLAMDIGEEYGNSNPWKGAEALHYWNLAHSFLYEGNLDGAMRVAMLLKEYEGILKAQDIYSLLALTAFYNQYYQQASKAFMKLESLQDISDNDRQAYSEIAMSIFTQHKPVDPKKLRGKPEKRPGVVTMKDDAAKNRELCVASGKIIKDPKWKRCRTCKHPMLLAELRGRRHCPLCHSPLADTKAQSKDVSHLSSTASSTLGGLNDGGDGDEDPRFKNLFSALN